MNDVESIRWKEQIDFLNDQSNVTGPHEKKHHAIQCVNVHLIDDLWHARILLNLKFKILVIFDKLILKLFFWTVLQVESRFRNHLKYFKLGYIVLWQRYALVSK